MRPRDRCNTPIYTDLRAGGKKFIDLKRIAVKRIPKKSVNLQDRETQFICP